MRSTSPHDENIVDLTALLESGFALFINVVGQASKVDAFGALVAWLEAGNGDLDVPCRCPC
jgi:hypothetical protein